MRGEKVKEQLGMPIGTAQNRLVKLLLFHLAQQLGLDVCFQCKEKIETAKQLSIEHKKPWLDVSPDLYWDIKNIAFSHLSCNVAAGRRDVVKLAKQLSEIRKDHVTSAPNDMAWCYGHRDFLEKKLFNRNKWYPSGVQRFCKKCRSKGIGRISRVGTEATAPVS